MGARLKLSYAGESHGPALVAVLEGLPGGLRLDRELLTAHMARRLNCLGRGKRSQGIERDQVELLSGVRRGRTTGAPLALLVRNLDHAAWEQTRGPWAMQTETPEPISVPRPGHADFSGWARWGGDIREVIERSSARFTALDVAAGALISPLLVRFGIRVFGATLSVGQAAAQWRSLTARRELERAAVDPAAGPSKTFLRAAAEQIKGAADRGETLGGRVAVIALGVPPGLGNVGFSEQRLDARLAGALMGIPAVRAVELGEAYLQAGIVGTAAQDRFLPAASGRSVRRAGNLSGGIEGGLSNGQPLIIKLAVRPVPSAARPLRSVDLTTGAAAAGRYERSDICAVPAVARIAEARCALVLADALLSRFGGEDMAELMRAYASWKRRG